VLQVVRVAMRTKTKSASSLHRGKIFEALLPLKSFTIYKLSQIVLERTETLFAELPLGIRHFVVLQALLEEGPHSQQELCEGLWIDRATMVSVMKDLIKHKYAQKKVSATDKRCFTVAITPAGAKWVEKLRSKVWGLDDELTAGLDEKRCRLLAEILVAMVSKVSP
jgi:DNA-binding MarR family transcriptional regulator